MLGESRMMIPDCHKRLEAALADLKSTLVTTLSLVVIAFAKALTWSQFMSL